MWFVSRVLLLAFLIVEITQLPPREGSVPEVFVDIIILASCCAAGTEI